MRVEQTYKYYSKVCSKDYKDWLIFKDFKISVVKHCRY
jgi:hypothetical protein